MGILLIIISFLLTKLILIPLANLLTGSGAVRENFLGNPIPIGMGLVIWLSVTPSLLIYERIGFNSNLLIYLLTITITLLMGFADDLLGNHEVKGLKGHLSRLLRNGEITSGSLKALVISIISFFISLKLSTNLSQWFINFCILILMTNTFNLLDVRPGRSIKIYLLAATVLFINYPSERYFLGIITASIIAYAPWDFKAKAMLGDTGSNLLGMVIGMVVVTNLHFLSKGILLLSLILLHIYTEYRSLTTLIERNYILRILDNLGR